MISKGNKYFAFISYKREDEGWAKWIQEELENYHLPVTLNGRADLPSKFRPVFRDVDELKAGNLPEQIYDALSDSTYLIVICSPKAAKSKWVNKEIADFIEIGKAKGVDNVRNIFPFIVAGHPHAQNQDEECFPKSLLDLPDSKELVGGNINEGGNVNENGRDKAFVKVMAGMLPNVAFDELWNRYEHDKAEKERREREEREKFLRIQSRLVGEKAINIQNNTSLAQRIALEVLPKDLSNPDRPLTIEAERALRQSSVQCEMVLKGHRLGVSDIAFTSDAKQLASIANDFTIKIWDTDTGTLINTISCDHPFGHCITYSPDNKYLLAVFSDEVMIIWDVETGSIINSLDLNQIPNIPKGVHSIACDSTFEKVALAEFGGIHVISFVTDQVYSFEVNNPKSITFSPDGRYLVATSANGINFWDFVEGDTANMNLSDGIDPRVSQIAFSSDGRQVVFVFDNIIGLLDISDGSNVQTFGKSDSLYVGVSFCNDDKYIATISEEGIIMIWDVKTLTEVSANYEEIPDVIHHDVNKVVFSSKGNLVGVVSEGKNIVVKSILSPFVYQIFKEPTHKIGDISCSPNGKFLVDANRVEPFELSIWDIEKEKIVHRLSGHSERIFSVAYSHDGDFIVSGSYDSTIRIWETKTGNCVKIIDACTKNEDSLHAPVGAVVFSPNNNYIASGLYSGEVVIWDIKSEKILHILQGGNPQRGVSFNPKGDRIIAGGVNQEIKMWDVQSGNLVMTLKGHTGAITAVEYSPNGKYIVSASDDKSIICWDADNGSIQWQLRGPERGISCLSYSLDGNYIAATTDDVDYPVIVCDSKTGRILVAYKGLMAPAESVTFCPDSRHIVSAGIDGSIIIWDFAPLQELIDRTHDRFEGKPLTQEERVKYYLE